MSYFNTSFASRYMHFGTVSRPAKILFEVQTVEKYDWEEEVKAVHMRNLGRALLIIAIEALEITNGQN